MSDLTFRRLKRAGMFMGILMTIIMLGMIWFYFRTKITPPDPGQNPFTEVKVENPSPDYYRIGHNWLRKNSNGLWEMYTEGKPYERGVINGKLSKHLIDAQEKAFVDRIREMVPSDFYLRFLKYFIYWFNRDLDQYIPEEYRLEIFGISLSASDQFSFIGSAYQRMLNYHSAHDIGHALQDYNLVGCTSFAVWDGNTRDSSMIIGRNFDFYVGDEFARNKIVSFVKPDKGYGFMTVTWGGMIGAVSGMNEEGLTVTINAAKSDLPTAARTPISILAREILQYASNISEAVDIANSRKIFVSESILVGSAKDKKAIIVEKSPGRTGLVIPSTQLLTCANHFQSEEFSSDPLNILDMKENASVYRNRRLLQLITNYRPFDPAGVATLLRDRQGLNGANIGMGNEKAINQLIAHHSIIFQPEQRLVWVSTPPWQLGQYVCYNLTEIFHNFVGQPLPVEIDEAQKRIPEDSFLTTNDYKKFLKFRAMRKELRQALALGNAKSLPVSFIEDFRNTNPLYYEVYDLIGDYYSQQGYMDKARESYLQALRMEVPRWHEKEKIINKLK